MEDLKTFAKEQKVKYISLIISIILSIILVIIFNHGISQRNQLLLGISLIGFIFLSIKKNTRSFLIVTLTILAIGFKNNIF